MILGLCGRVASNKVDALNEFLLEKNSLFRCRSCSLPKDQIFVSNALSEPFCFYEKRMRSKRLINILELILHSKNHRSGAKVFHNTLAPVEFIQNCALARNW